MLLSCSLVLVGTEQPTTLHIEGSEELDGVTVRPLIVTDASAAIFILSIFASVACLALAIGRALVVRPKIGNYLFGFLVAPLLLLVVLLFPVYSHAENPVTTIHLLIAYTGYGFAYSLPADWQSRTIKVVAFAATLSLCLAYMYLDRDWVTAAYARRANRIASWGVKAFAISVEGLDVGKLSGPIWADEHPNPDISELAKYRGPSPRYSLIPQWHTCFSGLYRVKETPQRFRITPIGKQLRIEAVQQSL